jgi:hypothetical protein
VFGTGSQEPAFYSIFRKRSLNAGRLLNASLSVFLGRPFQFSNSLLNLLLVLAQLCEISNSGNDLFVPRLVG